MSDSDLDSKDSIIRYDLYRKAMVAKVLVLLSEEPCYISELTGRLLLARAMVNSAIHYLEHEGLIYGLSDDISDERLVNFIKVKRQRFKQRLTPKLAESLNRRTKFYFVTERGKGFLDHAKKSLYGAS